VSHFLFPKIKKKQLSSKKCLQNPKNIPSLTHLNLQLFKISIISEELSMANFFTSRLPLSTNQRKPDTTFPTPTFEEFVWNGVFQKHLLFSPNLIWLIITVIMYFLFPYDFIENPNSSSSSSSRIAPVSLEFFKERFPLWFGVSFAYFSFWHIAGLSRAKTSSSSGVERRG
jgi:hypothetical protein